ncbi:MAG: polysaccharide biosynthesis protein [Candidatus Neomarinimicrobiota bacterium]|nr:MAG: polysaccharide biosynthesis protein [Candidatus Neomarinimicrobiota bacterium]
MSGTMRSRLTALSRQSLIYGLGHILSRIITFLLLPLYTNVFTPEEYGLISLAYTFLGFMNVILHYGLDAALMKYYVPAEAEERKTILTTAWGSFLVSSGAFAVISFLFRSPLSRVILGGDFPRYMGYVIGILVLDVLWSVPMLIFRSEQKPIRFFAFSLFNVLASLGLNLLFVLRLGWGIEGVFASNLVTSATLFLLTFPALLARMRWSGFSSATWKRLMRFGLPFLPSGIFAMIMELADRYLLLYFTDTDTVGLYSAGYKLGMFMLLAVMGFNMGWQPFFLKEGDGDSQRRLYTRITTYVLTLLGFLWVLLVVWVPDLVQLRLGSVTLYGPEYWTSVSIVPWVALGYWFHAAYLLQLPGVFLKEQSRYVPLFRGLGAGLNILLNLVMIPLWQGLGAAVATCLSFFGMALAIYLVNRKLYPLAYEWTRLLRVGGLMVMTAGGISVWGGTLPGEITLTLLFPVGLVLSGFLRKGEWQTLKKLLLPAQR